MAKKGLHPEWYNTKIFCDGKLVLEVGTTKKELLVDIWAGNTLSIQVHKRSLTQKVVLKNFNVNTI